MERFKGKQLYKTRVRKQSVKNAVINVEKIYNRGYTNITHKYYYPKTREFTLSKPEQEILIKHLESLGFKVKKQKFKHRLIIRKIMVSTYESMMVELMDKLD
ncbi:hypothetical protein LCFBJUUZ_CDS0155 [Staphylococcus phage PG-2021_76]